MEQMGSIKKAERSAARYQFSDAQIEAVADALIRGNVGEVLHLIVAPAASPASFREAA